MAKKNQKSKRTKSAKPQQSNAAKAKSRRAFIQYGIAGAAVLGLGGYFGVTSLQASICEADLTKLGKGTPTIVQIHDPTCPVCNALQKEARKAIKNMDGSKPEFLVANIKTLEGSTFAADHGVPNITLLLFDAKGEVQQILRGPQDRADLTPLFEDLMRRHRPRT